MSTANKNYPLIKENDSNGQPLDAYDQLVTESNNFRRAVDNDINEVENKVSSLEEDVSLAFNDKNINIVRYRPLNVDVSKADFNNLTDYLVLSNGHNSPLGTNHFYYVETIFYGTKSLNSNRKQTAYAYQNNGMWTRTYTNGSWTSWTEH